VKYESETIRLQRRETADDDDGDAMMNGNTRLKRAAWDGDAWVWMFGSWWVTVTVDWKMNNDGDDRDILVCFLLISALRFW